MSRFLNELKDVVGQCQVMNWSNGEPCSLANEDEVNEAVKLIESLGENARRMLEIGIVQDELIKLGMFECANDISKVQYPDFDKEIPPKVVIHFTRMFAGINLKYYFEYASLTWQDDLLSKAKELINE